MLDFSYFFIILPLAFAIICAFNNKRNKMPAGLAITVLSVCLAGACLVYALQSGTQWFFGDSVLSYFMLIVIFMIALAVAIYANSAARTKRRGSYFAMLLVISAGMAGIVCARDFFTLYVFLEVVSVASFALISFYNRPLSTEGAIRYFYLSAIASALILFAISLLVVYTGSPSYTSLIETIFIYKGNPAGLNIILGVLALAFMIKTGLFPFHSWTPDAYESATSPVSALLAGVVTKVAGTYALVIVCMLLSIINFGIDNNVVGKAIMWFGLASVIFGALAAQEQKDFKRMLAYSSISQMGYITLAAALATPLAMAGAMLHMFNHATFKSTLYFCAGNIKHATGTNNINDLNGLQSKMPYTSFTATIAMLSTAGLPPFSGFWSKFLIIAALWQSNFKGMAAAALFTSVLTLAYFLRIQKGLFFGHPSANVEDVEEMGFGFTLPCIVLALIIVLAGIYFPFSYTNFVEPFIKVLQ